MHDDASLARLAEQAGQHLLALHRRVVTAESCTGGWIGKALTDIAGSSTWFDRAYVTYSNEAKQQDLGVLRTTLEQHGAVSEQTAVEMVRGALARSGADVAIAVTGIAGPDGGSDGKPAGTVWLALQWQEPAGKAVPVTRIEHFAGGRDAVRRQTVATALCMLLDDESLSSRRARAVLYGGRSPV